jgi:hypothetical protein
MMAAIDLVTSTVLDLQYNENMLNESIAGAQDLIFVMTGEAFDLSQILNEVTSTLEENVAELGDAVVMESNMMESRNAALIVLDEATINMSNMSYSGDCAICDVDVNGNGYVNTNDLDLDGVCDDADILGCTNESSINYDASATTDDDSCIQSWADMEDMIQNQLDAAYASGYDEGYTEGSASSASLIDVHLDLPSGWSMFGYTCLDSQNVTESLVSIASEIEIVKDELGMSYLPDWGFDAIGEFSHGEGYQIKLHSTVEGFQFCKTLTQE